MFLTRQLIIQVQTLPTSYNLSESHSSHGLHWPSQYTDFAAMFMLCLLTKLHTLSSSISILNVIKPNLCRCQVVLLSTENCPNSKIYCHKFLRDSASSGYSVTPTSHIRASTMLLLPVLGVSKVPGLGLGWPLMAWSSYRIS